MHADPAQFIAEEVRAFRDGVRNLRVTPTVTSDEIRRRLESYSFAHEMPLTDGPDAGGPTYSTR